LCPGGLDKKILLKKQAVDILYQLISKRKKEEKLLFWSGQGSYEGTHSFLFVFCCCLFYLKNALAPKVMTADPKLQLKKP